MIFEGERARPVWGAWVEPRLLRVERGAADDEREAEPDLETSRMLRVRPVLGSTCERADLS